MGIEQAIDETKIAEPANARAGGQLSGDVRITHSREGSDLVMV
jgi:hypothetical protein